MIAARRERLGDEGLLNRENGHPALARYATGRMSITVSNASIDQRLQLLVAAIRDYAIYLLDPGGHVASWNAGAERFKGYSASEIMGRHYSEFFTPEDRAAGLPEHGLRTALAEGKFESEGWRVRKDGTRFWANVVVDAIYDEKGTLVGYAKITRDVTDRKRAEDALRDS